MIFGQTYPMRMVDHVAAAREARERIAKVRHPERAVSRPTARPEAGQADLPFHNKRPKGIRRPGRGPVQLSFDLGLTGVAPENRPV